MAPTKGKRQQRGPPRKEFTKKRRKRQIVFDPEARREYLCGFSERKRQRRAYGLAMQKCKDRQQKLEDRRETKKAEMEQVLEAERLKQQDDGFVVDAIDDDDDRKQEQPVSASNDGDEGESKHTARSDDNRVTYQDVATMKQFGGAVIVTTSTMPNNSDSDEDIIQPKKNKHSIDEEQRYAGNVNKFLHELKGRMPSKKKKLHAGGGGHHKGKHGASTMKGMGGASDMKLARKTLTKAQQQGQGRKRGYHKKR